MAGLVCEKCGKDLLTGYDTGFDDGGEECPDCGKLLCFGCARWKNLRGKTACGECASKYLPIHKNENKESS